MVEIKRKAALVTGAGKRIGRAIALDLAAQGWAVGVHYLNSRKDADIVVAEIAERGGVAAAFHADLERESDVQRLVPAVAERLGALTLLVNNASRFERDEVADVTRESWDRHMESNLRAPFVLSQAFAAQLPAEERGLIVNILDQRVWNLTPHFISYTLSKAGLWTLTQTLALALAPRIRVNGIGPGPTLRNVRQTEEEFAEQRDSTPLQRGTSPEEICAALRFLIDAPAVTGQMIALDGGEHLGWAQATRGFVPIE
ncbi:SDR family oxidoreductase [Azospirillum rugosum]|uniref:NAD(P)-dependent dehydrogenase (Short-subunit alcohol dehydrogenase family) n=1 Tax=Azospirillum rugosum TaxID=416170 RepID=A0ABS4SXK9_9PROT|nr:SDR family oxidoreductase [Azospirillum rugosum]MBP2297281.1 NAD(P)-dependent dehydrogenase (short-subunit alcohol dehydrogenase family) [Azospirillum rugosum]MDQ0531123.1 NAD(P)-dependent dehydrogenase (short-subunit alcohol dehydrogenase family) [Azospirillum rugosum]